MGNIWNIGSRLEGICGSQAIKEEASAVTEVPEHITTDGPGTPTSSAPNSLYPMVIVPKVCG